MDVRLSSEQEALRDAAARVVGQLGVHTVADLDDPERSARLEAAVLAAGWRELRAADETGAPWASGVETAIVAEELGRGLADAPFVGPTLAADLRRHAGAASCDGETVVLDAALGGLALETDDRAVAVDAQRSATGLTLTPEHRLGAVALDDPCIDVDLTRASRSVRTGVATTMIQPSGPVSTDAQQRWTALGLALTCADLVGVMRGAIALTTDYAKDRRQYGVAVGSFQAVQHLLADALVAAEGGSSVTRHAAWAVDALDPAEALAAGAVAKAYCARAARTVCETAIQVHGGIGNTWECIAHVYLRRALVSIEMLGGVGPSLDRVLASRGIGDDDGLR